MLLALNLAKSGLGGSCGRGLVGEVVSVGESGGEGVGIDEGRPVFHIIL